MAWLWKGILFTYLLSGFLFGAEPPPEPILQEPPYLIENHPQPDSFVSEFINMLSVLGLISEFNNAMS